MFYRAVCRILHDEIRPFVLRFAVNCKTVKFVCFCCLKCSFVRENGDIMPFDNIFYDKTCLTVLVILMKSCIFVDEFNLKCLEYEEFKSYSTWIMRRIIGGRL